MKQIRLDLEQLNVESFDTTMPEVARRGTVHGHNETENDSQCYGVCHTDVWGLGCGDNQSLICEEPTVGCSQDTPYATFCDFSCEWACPQN